MSLKFLLALLMALPLTAHSHSFVVKPDQMQMAPGSTLGASVLMTEKLFEGQRLLAVGDVHLRLLTKDGETAVPLNADAAAKALRAEFAAPQGSVLLAARAAPRYRAIDKKEKTTDPARTVRIETFAKALLNLAPGDIGFARRSADRLEMVFLDNPAEWSAGAPLRVQVLFGGQPLATRVQAMSPGQPRVSVDSDADGMASLTLGNAGVWLLRSSHQTGETDERSSRYQATSSLVFNLE